MAGLIALGEINFVLFGFKAYLALHLVRSPLSLALLKGIAGDQINVLMAASLAQQENHSRLINKDLSLYPFVLDVSPTYRPELYCTDTQ